MYYKSKSNIKTNRGITLVALVITIIVLLILAGITISLILEENGLLSRSEEGKNAHEKGMANDINEMDKATEYMNSFFTRSKSEKIVKCSFNIQGFDMSPVTEFDITFPEGSTWSIDGEAFNNFYSFLTEMNLTTGINNSNDISADVSGTHTTAGYWYLYLNGEHVKYADKVKAGVTYDIIYD